MAFNGVLHLRIRKRKANQWLRRSPVRLRRLEKVSESVAEIRQPLARRSLPPNKSVEYNPIVIRAARLFALAFVLSWRMAPTQASKLVVRITISGDGKRI